MTERKRKAFERRYHKLCADIAQAMRDDGAADPCLFFGGGAHVSIYAYDREDWDESKFRFGTTKIANPPDVMTDVGLF